VQRFFDLLFATAALVALAPLLIVVMVILRLTGEGDVFYRQERVGLGGRCFGLLKFATMLRASPSIGAGEITVKDDPRVLPFGRFLRKTKINELPQLWNVVIGDLSLVGPRPMVPKTFAVYPPAAQETLNTVRPGLSGVGSIVFRDEETLLAGLDDPRGFYDREIIPYKAGLECWYVAHRSQRMYFEVILLTLWVVLTRNSTLAWRVWPSLPRPPMTLCRSAARLNATTPQSKPQHHKREHDGAIS
jgi:lipopolysaccharide/colanic/teichoic acid biosynthesis glycosyltransferase